MDSKDKDTASMGRGITTKAATCKAVTPCSQDPAWYLDSACSGHITWDRSVFLDSDLPPSNLELEIADKRITKAYGQGTACLDLFVNGKNVCQDIYHVHYLLDSINNLLSIVFFDCCGLTCSGYNRVMQLYFEG